MDSFLNNNEQNCVETRWDRIEKKHINSAVIYDHSDAAAVICKNLIQNHEYIPDTQLKAMLGEKPKRLCLDPNLVMDIRHSRIKRRHKSASDGLRRRAKGIVDERSHFQKMFQLHREIEKFKKSLENVRPKMNHFKGVGIREPSYSACSIQSLKIDMSNREIDNIDEIPPQSLSTLINDVDGNNDEIDDEIDDGIDDEKQHEFMAGTQHEIEKKNEEDNQSPNSLSPTPIPSESLIDETSTNDADKNSFMHDNHIYTQSGTATPCSSSQMMLRTVFQQPQFHQSNDDFEFIITPTIMVNIQDTIRTNSPHEFDRNHGQCQTKPIGFHRDSKIAVNQHMSILIKKITNEAGAEKSNIDSCINEHGHEGSNIINQVHSTQPQDNFILLQRYFLQWVHFTTIEKLKRRNPAQTRLQKMEAFLQNITFERKKALNKLRHHGNTAVSKRDEDHKRMVLHDPSSMESPRLLIRTYNNKLKTQQDIIELQRIKLQRQQRVITELKLSKLLEDTDEAKSHLREELSLVAKNGCANSRSKAKCLQMISNLKDKEEINSDIQAKGMAAPKFLVEMQARALERKMRHEEAQKRREALEREKEALRIAAEEEKRLLDEEAKRQRIKEYWRKRREEKELEAKKALERMKFLANVEIAKAFNRERILKQAMKKFKNLVKWKIRNKTVSNELRRQILYRSTFVKWRKYTVRVWDERKTKAIECHNRHCLKMAWAQWQQHCRITQSKTMLAEDWFHLRLTERVFRAWERITAQTRLVYEIKQKHAEAHFNWYMKWKVLEHWRRLHAILKIEKETEARRERWRNKIYGLIPDYTPNVEFI